MSHGDHHWHATDECFNCFNCKALLLGKPFLPRRGCVFCSITCSKITQDSYLSQLEDVSHISKCQETISSENESCVPSLDQNSTASCSSLNEYKSSLLRLAIQKCTVDLKMIYVCNL